LAGQHGAEPLLDQRLERGLSLDGLDPCALDQLDGKRDRRGHLLAAPLLDPPFVGHGRYHRIVVLPVSTDLWGLAPAVGGSAAEAARAGGAQMGRARTSSRTAGAAASTPAAEQRRRAVEEAVGELLERLALEVPAVSTQVKGAVAGLPRPRAGGD